MCLMPYANNKGADQPAHPRSLISAFVVRCQDRMIPLVYISEIPRFWLVSVAEQVSLCLACSETSEDTFSHGVTHTYSPLHFSSSSLVFAPKSPTAHLADLRAGPGTGTQPGTLLPACLGPEMMVMSFPIPPLPPNVAFAGSSTKSSNRSSIQVLTAIYVKEPTTLPASTLKTGFHSTAVEAVYIPIPVT